MSNFFDEGTNAVNNTDGFSTGYLDRKKKPTKPTFGMPVNNNAQPNTQMPATPVGMQQNQFNNNQYGQNHFNNQRPQQMANRPAPNQQRPQNNMNRQMAPGNRRMPNPNAMQKQTGATIKKVNTRKFSKYINYLSMSILVVTIVIVLLIAGGVINVNKNKKGQAVSETPVNTNPEEDKEKTLISNLNIACGSLDKDGNFGTARQSDDPNCDVLICYLKDTVSCINGTCLVVSDTMAYSKDCASGKIIRAEKNEYQARINALEACDVLKNNPSSNGYYEGSRATCTNSICTAEYGGKTVEVDCSALQ